MSHLCANNSRRAALSILFSISRGPCPTFRVQGRRISTAKSHHAASNAKRLLRDDPVEECNGTIIPTSSMLQDSKKLKSDVRALLRDIAQPVAVVTSFMPSDPSSSSSTTNTLNHEKSSIYHGATLSSFTSIAMDPYPLIAFSLRIPSRMASALTTLSRTGSALASDKAHMVVNLLSASQASTSVMFSRPDLHPTPFVGTSASAGVPYTLSDEQLPILDGVVGAISCRLVGGPIPLYDLDHLELSTKGTNLTSSLDPGPIMPVLGRGGVASELFIARVVRVERVRSEEEEVEDDCERTLPLVYHRRGYTSCYPKS